jgi:hypothetical protein
MSFEKNASASSTYAYFSTCRANCGGKRKCYYQEWAAQSAAIGS